MLAETEVKKTISLLDLKYRDATTTPVEAKLYSKLALIELCGWLEEAMDEIVKRCARRRLKDVDNVSYCETQIVDQTYGFEYEKHFRTMLMRTVGLIGVEWVESQVDDYHYNRLKSNLGTLKVGRNSAAHTHITGATQNLSAPSVALNQLTQLKEDLSLFDKFISRKNW